MTIPHVNVDFSPGHFSNIQFKFTGNNQWELVAATSGAQGIKAIQYGIYAGECGGYCLSNIVITADSITYTKDGWGRNTPEIAMRSQNTQENWQNLIELVDFPLFESFPDVIGCPDCADQGGEFIEIQFEEKHKRIDFNYSIDSSLNALTKTLQTLFEQQETLFSQATQ